MGPRPDSLVPCATLNPAYAGWERDLRQCREEWDMHGVRLFSQHHGFKLAGPVCLELVRSAVAAGMYLQISLRLEDRRQRHWMDTTRELRLDELAPWLGPAPRPRYRYWKPQDWNRARSCARWT